MLKKKEWDDNALAIFDDAMILRRENGWWYYRQWLTTEKRDYRVSLKTRSQVTAAELGKKQYFEIMARVNAGMKVYSPSIDDGIAQYLQYRSVDVQNGAITSGRFSTIATHLKNWRRYLKQADIDPKVKNINRDDCLGYFAHRSSEGASKSTIVNEQASIGACWSYLYDHRIVDYRDFDFGKSAKVDHGVADLTRRQTFSDSEAKQFLDAYKKYAGGDGITQDERRKRFTTYYYFRLAFASGLRTGEQRQIKAENFRALAGHHNMIEIFIPAETSKVRQSRDVIVDKISFLDYKKTLDFGANGYVFADNDGEPISEKTLLRHFKAVLVLSDIPGGDIRNLVPYSTRHYYATRKLMHGVQYDVLARAMGTSVMQLMVTYRHVQKDELMKVAVALEIPSLKQDPKFMPEELLEKFEIDSTL